MYVALCSLSLPPPQNLQLCYPHPHLHLAAGQLSGYNYLMGIRNIQFAEGEYYHIYNRGVDRRDIVNDNADANRLLQSLTEFNCEEVTGGLYELSFAKKRPRGKPLVDLVCYCLNPNHFHLLIREIKEGGISKFMHRFIGGYSKYFNNRNKRKGTLFEGRFKAKHVSDNDYLLHASAYINLNDRVHQLRDTLLVRSSWNEYVDTTGVGACTKNIVLEQFKSRNEYKIFAEGALTLMLEKRPDYKELLELE